MKRALLILGVLCIVGITTFRFFPTPRHIPIQKWDEHTNIAVVTNPLSIKYFPLLYKDSQPFFEKPPLWYWVTIITAKPDTDILSARMVSAICGFLTLLLTTYLSWRWWGFIAGLFTWILLVTTNHLFTINPAGSFSTHTLWSADLESMHILFLMLSFATLTRTSKLAATIAGITAGLSVLAKSPLGLLPLVVATLIHPSSHRPSNYALSWGAMIVTILPWYLWMISQFHLPFLATHFSYHIVARIALPLEGHIKSIWYYVQIVSERRFFLSWEWLVGSILFIFLQKLHKESIVKFTLIMAGATFIIPTIMSTKLAWYVLPFYPFAALLVGFATSRFVHLILKATRGYTTTRTH